MKATCVLLLSVVLLAAVSAKTLPAKHLEGSIVAIPQVPHVLMGGIFDVPLNKTDVISHILLVPALHARAHAGALVKFRSILEKGTLLKHQVQIVNGANEWSLFKTSRGYECFRLYGQAGAEVPTLSNYARGSTESVYEKCRDPSKLAPQFLVAAVFHN